MSPHPIPIVAIDGTASSGKGTIAYKLAQYFGFNYLNTGALYRLVAYEAFVQGVALEDKENLVRIAREIQPTFIGKQVIINGDDVWPIIGTQTYGNPASIVSRIPEVRQAIFSKQREMIHTPGLVAEGRDMCTHVFQDAQVKIYFDADPKIRAERRYKDALETHSGKTFEQILEELMARDERDKDPNKIVGRLFPAPDALIIDSTDKGIDDVMKLCIDWCKKHGVESHSTITKY